MAEKGLKLKEGTDDVAFEAESDSIELYTMISNEFDYEQLR